MRRAEFYDHLRDHKNGLFSGSLTQSHVDGMEGILNAFVHFGDGRDKTLAYALATAYHETGSRMVPVREGFASNDASARNAVNQLATKRGPNSNVAKYAKPTGPYGHVYYGRGHVQLTWHNNYIETGQKIDIDLERYPDKMLDPEISARVLIEGLIDGRWNGQKKGISHYLPAKGKDNLKDARRTVNVTDRWQLIAGYYQTFLEAIGVASGVPTVVAKPIDAPAETSQRPSIPSDIPESVTGNKEIIPILLSLMAILDKNRKGAETVAENADETEILKQLLAAMQGGGASEPPQVGPVNGWLGQTIGRLLNGRKTATGILGLIGTVLIPGLFPSTFAPLLQVFDLTAPLINATAENAEVASEAVKKSAEGGQSFLQWVFGLLATWGLAGKVEKAKEKPDS